MYIFPTIYIYKICFILLLLANWSYVHDVKTNSSKNKMEYFKLPLLQYMIVDLNVSARILRWFEYPGKNLPILNYF